MIKRINSLGRKRIPSGQVAIAVRDGDPRRFSATIELPENDWPGDAIVVMEADRLWHGRSIGCTPGQSTRWDHGQERVLFPQGHRSIREDWSAFGYCRQPQADPDRQANRSWPAGDFARRSQIVGSTALAIGISRARCISVGQSRRTRVTRADAIGSVDLFAGLSRGDSQGLVQGDR